MMLQGPNIQRIIQIQCYLRGTHERELEHIDTLKDSQPKWTIAAQFYTKQQSENLPYT